MRREVQGRMRQLNREMALPMGVSRPHQKSTPRLLTCSPDRFSSSSASAGSTLPCPSALTPVLLRQRADFSPQSYMGLPARAHHNYRLRDPRLPALRSPQMDLLHRPQHHPVRPRRPDRPPLPLLLHPQRQVRPEPHTLAPRPRPTPPRRRHILPRLTLRLHRARARRLRHLHPRQSLQAATRHADTHHRVPEAAPAL